MITDAGLEHLKRLKSLRVVYLTGTQLTQRGIGDLRSASPNGKIVP
jgi:hypothetical protein